MLEMLSTKSLQTSVLAGLLFYLFANPSTFKLLKKFPGLQFVMKGATEITHSGVVVNAVLFGLVLFLCVYIINISLIKDHLKFLNVVEHQRSGPQGYLHQPTFGGIDATDGLTGVTRASSMETAGIARCCRGGKQVGSPGVPWGAANDKNCDKACQQRVAADQKANCPPQGSQNCTPILEEAAKTVWKYSPAHLLYDAYEKHEDDVARQALATGSNLH